jgi:hypothetical protein
LNGDTATATWNGVFCSARIWAISSVSCTESRSNTGRAFFSVGQSPVSAKTLSMPSARSSRSVFRNDTRSLPTHVRWTFGWSPRARTAVPTRSGSWPNLPPA